jgi:hypothetical protein
MLKKTRKERNRKKTLNKRLSKNNKKHTFRRKNTKNLTKKNKMLGGHFCIFETRAGSKEYSCDPRCNINEYRYTIPSRYFYYHGNGDTLFGFNSHLFKHLDKNEPLRNSLTNINFVKKNKDNNSVLFSLEYGKYPILKLFIDEIKRIINDNNLTYAFLKQTKNNDNEDNMFTSGPFNDVVYPYLIITWSKKSRLPTNNPPLPITDVGPYTKFVQLHSLSYDGRPDIPVCTRKNGQNLSSDNDVNFDQKQNFLPTKEQYKNASLTGLPTMAEFIQIAADKSERDKAIKDAAALERQQEEEAALKRQNEAESAEKALVYENIKITKSLIERLYARINIVDSHIKTILVNFNSNLDEICDALSDYKEGRPINKINAELKNNINAIITYLKQNGLNKTFMQQKLEMARNNLIKPANETKNRGLTDLNTILTEFLLTTPEEAAIEAAAALAIPNDAEAAPVRRNEEATQKIESGLSKKEIRKKLRKMKKGEVLDEDSL